MDFFKRVILGIVAAIPFVCQADSIEYVNSTLWQGVQDVKVVGQTAYCSFYNGLAVMDVSDPANIQMISKLYCPGRGEELAIRDEIVYLADGDAGLCIIDVSNPEEPVLLAMQDLPGSSVSVHLDGQYAYVAAWWHGLQIVDISNPEQPFRAGFMGTEGGALGVTVRDTIAYIADHSAGAQIVDVSDPTLPMILSTIEVTGVSHDVELVGDLLYVGSSDDPGSGLWIIDVSDPLNPVTMSSYGLSSTFSLDIAGDYAYLTGIHLGAWEVNISNPSAPFRESYWRAPDYCNGMGICAAGNQVYVACGSASETTYESYQSGLFVVDFSDPVNPVELGGYRANGQASGLCIDGEYSYVAQNRPFLRVLNTQEPTDPYPIGIGEYDNLSWDVFRYSNYAFVTKKFRGFVVYDVSNPLQPTFVALCNEPYDYSDIVVDNDIAYLTDGYGTIGLFDVSSLPEITPLGGCELDGYCYGLALREGYAFVATSEGMAVVSVEDELNPHVDVVVPYICTDVSVKENLAFLAADYDGLVILDVTDPVNPELVGTCPTSARAYKLSVGGDEAWMTLRDRTIAAFDITDPASPDLIDTIATSGYPWDVDVLDGYAYVCDNYSLKVFQIDRDSPAIELNPLPTDAELISNYPNPFNAVTTLEYRITQSGKASLIVYDMLGRKVTTLANGFMQAGSYRAKWNASGLPSGIYFADLKYSGGSQCIKVTLVK